jgi:hypothetical protein
LLPSKSQCWKIESDVLGQTFASEEGIEDISGVWQSRWGCSFWHYAAGVGRTTFAKVRVQGVVV